MPTPETSTASSRSSPWRASGHDSPAPSSPTCDRRRCRGVLARHCLGTRRRSDGRSSRPRGRLRQALHDRLPAAILERGTVRVGGSDPYPPAAFYAPDGRTVVGFEPDLAAEMGRVLGVRFEFVNLSFSDLLPQLRRHKIDIAMASMTEREKHADFVNYFQAARPSSSSAATHRGSAIWEICAAGSWPSPRTPSRWTCSGGQHAVRAESLWHRRGEGPDQTARRLA